MMPRQAKPRTSHRNLYRTFVATITAVLVGATFATTPVASAAQEEVSILLVGNSMSRGLKRDLKKLLDTGGFKARIQAATYSGYTLADHLASRKTMSKLSKLQAWDYVIIQEQSSGIPPERLESARMWIEYARAYSAVPILLMTWADRGIPEVFDDWLLGVPYGAYGYLAAATNFDAELAPAGIAFRRISSNGEWGGELWGPDGHHPSRFGNWVTALTVFRTMMASADDTMRAASRTDRYPANLCLDAVEYAIASAEDRMQP
jgi:hypothetical protein